MAAEMAGLKSLAKNLVDQLDLQLARAAVVAFDSTAQTLTGLSRNRVTVHNAIDSIAADGFTSVSAGLLTALDVLQVLGFPRRHPASR